MKKQNKVKRFWIARDSDDVYIPHLCWKKPTLKRGEWHYKDDEGQIFWNLRKYVTKEQDVLPGQLKRYRLVEEK